MIETVNGNWAILYMKNSGADIQNRLARFNGFLGNGDRGEALFHSHQQELHFPPSPLFTAIALFPTWVWPGSVFVCPGRLRLLGPFAPHDQLWGKGLSAAVAGSLIAFYLLGYGIAAFGVGPIESLGIPLKEIFGLSALLSLALGI